MYDWRFMVLTMVLAIPSFLASRRVKSTFKKYEEVGVRSNMTGAQAAQAILRAAGVTGVGVEPHGGFLSDHYDPKAKALRLSPAVYDGRSVSAIAVAAHEAGHAIQDATNYAPLVWRSKIVPVTNLGNRLWSIPFMLGLATSVEALAWVGVALFGAVVLFHFVTLPTELDASRRAKAVLADTGIVSTEEEADGVASVLRAAAMTYVAAALGALVQMLYLIMKLMARSRRN